MSVRILNHRRKPETLDVELDLNNPLTKGLVFYPHITKYGAINLVNGRFHDAVTGTAPTIEVTEEGYAIRENGNGSLDWTANVKHSIGTGPMTQMAFFKWDGTNAFYQTAIAVDFDTGLYLPGNGSAAANFQVDSLSGATISLGGSNSVIPDEFHCYLATFEGSSATATGFIDGVEDLNNTFVYDVGTDTSFQLGRGQGGEYGRGWITAGAVWDRVLSKAEIRSIWENPYQLLKYKQTDAVGKAPGAATTKTITTSLDALLQKQNNLKTVSIDALLQKTQSLQSSVDALIQAQGTEITTSVDALLLATQSATTSIDSVLSKQNNLTTTQLDAALKSIGNTLTTQIDAIVSGAGTKTTQVDAVLKKTTTKTTSLDALLQKQSSLNASLDAALLKQGNTVTATVDALLQKTTLLTASLDSVLTKRTLKTAQIDALLQATQTITTSLSALLLKQNNLSTASIDAIVRKLYLKTTSLDGLLQKTTTAETVLDALLQDTFELTTSIDAFLKKTVFMTTSLDSVMRKIFLRTASFDALLRKNNNLLTLTLDTALQDANGWVVYPKDNGVWDVQDDTGAVWAEQTETTTTWTIQ